MNLNSKYFDSIRIAPRKARGERNGAGPAETVGTDSRQCEWHGCRRPASHRAPKGRGRENEYRWFCLDHVRDYNRGYNFFQGMSDDEIASYQEGAATGHRPTWRVGTNTWSNASKTGGYRAFFEDPFGLFGRKAAGETAEKDRMPRRPPRRLERKALETLGLEATASLNEIKSRYKELVKRHHPDANGGDRSAEERLRQVIQAYDYLKKSGFC